MAEEDKSAEPRTTATKQPAIKKTTAKSAAAKTASATSQTPSKRTAAAKKSTASTARKRTTKAKTAAPQTVGEAPAPVIERTSPEQFGRVNVLDITPNVENGLFPARVELGEAFNVTAQVFIEGRTKAGATVSVRNARGREVERFAMTCTNPGLDRWEAMVKIGEHSDLKPWDADYAAVKRQLGEWQIVVEGWEDTYQSWLHDAAIKVEVNDDVENALESGAQLLARWADAKDSKLSAADKSVSPQSRAATSSSCTKPIRCATACPSRIRSVSAWNARSPASPPGISSSHVPKEPTTVKTARSFPATSRRRSPAWNAPQPKASTLCICRRSSRLA